MKKHLYLVIALFSALLLTSCNGSSTKKMLKAISADAEFVVVGDAATIVESAGGKIKNNQIELPSNIKQEIEDNNVGDLDELNEKIEEMGVDISCGALMFDFKKADCPILVFKIDNKKKFLGFIEDEDYDELDSDNKTTYYANESEWSSSYIAVSDNYIYFMPKVRGEKSDRKKMLRYLEKKINGAREKSYDRTPQGKYICKGNVFGFSMFIPKELRDEMIKNGTPRNIVEMYKGYLCGYGDILGSEAKIKIAFFDEDGKIFSFDNELMDYKARIDKKALSFFNNKQSLILAVSMKDVDWDKYFDMLGKNMSSNERAQISVVKGYLNRIDGTLAIGMGLPKGLESFYCLMEEIDMLKNVSATFVVQVADGKGKGLLADFKAFLESQNVPVEKDGKSYVVDLAEAGTLYFALVDDFLVFSTDKIKEYNNCTTVKEIDFTDHLSSIGLVLKRNNPLMKDLGIDRDIIINAYAPGKTFEMSVEAKIEGGKKGFMAEIIDAMLDVVGNDMEIDGKFRAYENKYESRYEAPAIEEYADTSFVEEAVEVDEWE